MYFASPHKCHACRPYHIAWSYCLNNIRWVVQIIIQFGPISFFSFLFSPNIFPNTLFCKWFQQQNTVLREVTSYSGRCTWKFGRCLPDYTTSQLTVFYLPTAVSI
jgi:hypothetical protein